MDNWEERCQALKVGKGMLITRLLTEIENEGKDFIQQQPSSLTKIQIGAKEIIEQKIKETENKKEDIPLDPWGCPLPF